jgi:Putative MetA-pathway of phenol degradation
MRPSLVLLAALLVATPVAAQQRPLITEDPEPIGAGRLLTEAGLDFAVDQQYPVSGLRGDLWRIPSLGLSIGISQIAELQIDGGLYNRLSIDSRNPNAPLASMLEVDGNSTSDIQDLVIGTKLRFLSERANRPSFALRFATKLPNASNESGLGLDTTDFFASLLAAKTVQSIRIVGNVGLGILTDPTVGNRQNDVLTYGFSLARALTDRGEVVAEVNGRASTRSGDPFPGTESRSMLTIGSRYTPGSIRFDGALLIGLTSIDPTIGFTAGITYVFNAFELP